MPGSLSWGCGGQRDSGCRLRSGFCPLCPSEHSQSSSWENPDLHIGPGGTRDPWQGPWVSPIVVYMWHISLDPGSVASSWGLHPTVVRENEDK